jgi:hypothetical protein
VKPNLKGELAVLFLLVGIAAIGGAISSVREPIQAPVPVTFETIADHQGEKVVIEGVIDLGSSVNCSNTTCSLPLQPEDRHDTGDLIVILWVVETTESEASPNCFALPDVYDPKEFRIYTDDGQTLALEDPIRVTGEVDHIGDTGLHTAVYVDVDTIESAR